MRQNSARTVETDDIRWDLNDLFMSLNDSRIQATLEEARTRTTAFAAAYKGKIANLSSAALHTALLELESILDRLGRLGEYANLVYAVDTGNDQVKAFEMKIRETCTDINNQLVFFDLELGRMEEALIRQHEKHPALHRYSYYLHRRAETAKYQLTEREEQLANIKDLTGSQAFTNLYEDLTAAFQCEFDLDGKTMTLTGEELRALRQHPEAEVRRRAMRTFLHAYREQRLVIASVFNHVIKDYNLERKWRGYPSPISVQNIRNNLDEATVRILHEATTASYDLVQNYYRLKARMIKLPDMTLADIYAPLPETRLAYSWPEAKKMVLAAFRGYDEDFYLKARSMFTEQRMDTAVRPGKRGGAFCSSAVPEIKPYILLNYQGRLRDVATMAHELGHAVHAMYSREQNLLNFHAILPLAETASIFAEMLLTDYLLQQEQDAAVKRALLASKLEEIFATSHRQNMFSRFEIAVHDRLGEGLLSADALCEIYRQELKLMFADAVQIPDEYAWEWATIPHMVAVPFYVYAYNFANLLVMSLFQQYQEEGGDFIPKFRKMLAQGSSASPGEITAIVGADINHPSFWQKGIQAIAKWVKELERLVD
ncbi:M3 family oligoendopeptidase [candidate division FCPU426 bacterium]|nr:M3 family oligoendopeptidase [candidate division FCPU426 bacterium]